MADNKKLKELGGVWEQESKSGTLYFKGKLKDGTRIVGFRNVNKKNEKEPDIRFYIDDKQDGKPAASKKSDDTPF
jgi:hypothetical protein